MRQKISSLTWVLVLSVVSLFPGCVAPRPSRTNAAAMVDRPYVLLVSIDAYRYDYTSKLSPPVLSRLAREGVAASSLVPAFPSKTFPNHLSIVTGLYPQDHGIVANTFYDFSRPPGDRLFRLADRNAVSDGSWYEGAPLWVEAERQGMLTASYFWPGGEAAIQGVRPTYAMTYDQKVPDDERVRKVLEWLRLPPETRPHFICLYFSDVDQAGHLYGTSSPELKAAVETVDHSVGLLLDELGRLTFQVNVIVVSDHGMQDTDARDVIYVDDLADLSGVTVGDLGPQMLIYGKDGQSSRLEKVFETLKKRARHFSVYRRRDVPARLHYSRSRRIGDLVLMAEAPYLLGLHDPRFKVVRGNHGYDGERVKTMQGIFYAQGPAFRDHLQIGSFDNIDIYPMLLKVLGLRQSGTIDGNPKTLDPILKR